MLHTLTQNQKVAEQVTSAKELIDQFRKSSDHTKLLDADRYLEQARTVDPDYLRAIYYSGIVKDLLGKPADAPAFFDRIVGEARDASIRADALYNLGIAYYHQYHRDQLKRAEETFAEVASTSSDVGLRTLAKANIGQTLAMRMHPTAEEAELLKKPATAKLIKSEIRRAFDEAITIGKEVLESSASGVRSRSKREMLQKAKAIAQNAIGAANMYFTDYLTDDTDEIRAHLEESAMYLTSAFQAMPKDWAIACNLASVNLRFFARCPGVDRDVRLKEAEQLLTLVLDTLRPDYGFARYELGRLRRCAADFTEAKLQFQQALAIDDRYRDVSKKKVELEIKRTEAGDVSFP